MRARSALPQDAVRAISAAAGAWTWAAAAWARTRRRLAGGGCARCRRRRSPGRGERRRRGLLLQRSRGSWLLRGRPCGGLLGCRQRLLRRRRGLRRCRRRRRLLLLRRSWVGRRQLSGGRAGRRHLSGGRCGAGAGACAASGIDMTTPSDATKRNCGDAGSCARTFKGRAATRAAATVHTATTRMTSPFRNSCRAADIASAIPMKKLRAQRQPRLKALKAGPEVECEGPAGPRLIEVDAQRRARRRTLPQRAARPRPHCGACRHGPRKRRAGSRNGWRL